jgi:nitroreductase
MGIVVCGDYGTSDVWIEDCSIACAFILLTAESLGLGSCWIQIRERMHDETTTAEAYVSRLLKIPESRKVEAIVAVGYPDERKEPYAKEELRYHKVHRNIFGTSYDAA